MFYLDNNKQKEIKGNFKPLPLSPPPVRPPRKNSPSMRAKNDSNNQQIQVNTSKREDQPISHKQIEDFHSSLQQNNAPQNTVGHSYLFFLQEFFYLFY